MGTNYDEIATEYKRAKQHPWRLHVEHFTLFKLLGDLRGKTVIDLAYGEGFYTIDQAFRSRPSGRRRSIPRHD